MTSAFAISLCADVYKRQEYDSSENLTGVCFLDTKRRPSENEDPVTVSTQETASSEYSAAVSPEESSLKPSVPEPKNYSAEDISMFRKQESVAELLFIAERYLGRILTPTDMNSILYWYDGLGFSTDLIEYLVEYCVSKGHTSIRYKMCIRDRVHTPDKYRSPQDFQWNAGSPDQTNGWNPPHRPKVRFETAFPLLTEKYQ